MTSARHRCFSLLMAKDWFTSCIPTSRYDTPGTFDKNHLVCHHRLIRLSTVNLKVKSVLQIAQHMAKQMKKNYTHRKLNTHKLNNPNAEKIVINRNEYSRIQSIYTNYAKITRYSMSKKQAMNNNSIQNTISENLSKGTSSTS